MLGRRSGRSLEEQERDTTPRALSKTLTWHEHMTICEHIGGDPGHQRDPGIIVMKTIGQKVLFEEISKNYRMICFQKILLFLQKSYFYYTIYQSYTIL